jgi:hypothetical protein
MPADGNIAPMQAFGAEERVEFQQVTAMRDYGRIETGLIDVQGVRDAGNKIQGRPENVLEIDPSSLRDVVAIGSFPGVAPICAYDLLADIDDAQIAFDRQIFLGVEDVVVAAV